MTGRLAKIRRRALAALALAAALPAAAYILPVRSILRHMGQRRDSLSLSALDVAGTLHAEGDAAQKLAASTGMDAAPGRLDLPARFQMKVAGRCKLEVAPRDLPDADRPFLSARDGRISGHGGLPDSPAATALVRALCTLLATSTAGDASGSYAAALARRGVALGHAALGRFDGRIAFVVGGGPREAKPLLYVDKDGYQPLRLIATEGGALMDVRLLGWGSPTGGDWFPRAVEVWEKDSLRLRFTTEKTVANPRLPDAIFP